MPARNRKGLSENTRARIQTTMIVKRLEKHIVSKPEFDEETNTWVNKDLMTQSQVSAALGLIKKTLPDLASIEYKGELVVTNASELTDDELANIATGSRSGASEQKKGEDKLH